MGYLAEGDPTRRREALIRLLRVGGIGAAVAGAGVWLHERSRRPEEPLPADLTRDLRVSADPALADAVVAQGDDPAVVVRRAVEELGGMRRFVSRGDVVVVKPNVAWDRTPAQGADTHPAVVAETVRLCLEAGARTAIVTDVTINDPQACFERSGIGSAARNAGAQVLLPDERRFRRVNLRGEVLGEWPVFLPFLEADRIINVPATKHHSLTGASLGIKNWYGILGGPRHRLHQRIHESLADLASFLRPTLTIMDAWRVLLRNGPTGGNPADVAERKTILAGIDPVALDAYAARAYWDLDQRSLRYLSLAAARGLGTTRFEDLRTRVVKVPPS